MSGPPLTLEKYRIATYHLSRPSRAQLEAFALHVSQAHSWYKSLPFQPPGEAFCFYIDPFAGMDLVQRAGAGFDVVWRDKPGFHYNQLPTAEHRERFGHLAFCSGGREMVPAVLSHIDGLRLPADSAPTIYDARLRDFRQLPQEVIRAGAARFSSVVHDEVHHSISFSDHLLSSDAPAWPEESGGPAALQGVRARLMELHQQEVAQQALPPEQRTYSMFREDAVVSALLAPERRRQHLGMIAAAERVLKLIEVGTAAD